MQPTPKLITDSAPGKVGQKKKGSIFLFNAAFELESAFEFEPHRRGHRNSIFDYNLQGERIGFRVQMREGERGVMIPPLPLELVNF